MTSTFTTEQAPNHNYKKINSPKPISNLSTTKTTENIIAVVEQVHEIEKTPEKAKDTISNIIEEPLIASKREDIKDLFEQ